MQRAASVSAPDGETRAGTRREAFRKERRLTRRKEYARVFAHPQRSVDRCFTVLHRPNGLPHARLGIALSRRRVRLAVNRNRIKRQVRESFRLHQGELGGVDIVVLAQPVAESRDNQTLRASLAWHWLKVQAARSSDS